MGESGGWPRRCHPQSFLPNHLVLALTISGSRCPLLTGINGVVVSVALPAPFPPLPLILDQGGGYRSMYDITDIRGMMDSKDQLDKMKTQLANQRWADFANGQPNTSRHSLTTPTRRLMTSGLDQQRMVPLTLFPGLPQCPGGFTT